MKRQVAIVGMGLVLLTCGAAVGLWRHLTRLPDWYHTSNSTSNSSKESTDQQAEQPPILKQQDFDDREERDQLETRLRQKLQAEVDDKISPNSIRLGEKDLNELIIVSANQSAQTQAYLEGIKGIKTEITTDQLKSEIVINFSEVNRDRLPNQHVQVLEELAAQFPILADQDILVTFDGKPQISNGELQLDPEMEAGIGGFQMMLTDLFGRFGVDLGSTPININLSDLDIQSVQYADGELIITSKAKQG